MIYSFPNTNFDIHQIANSGQCFRWKWIDTGTNQYYEVPIYDFDAKVMNGTKYWYILKPQSI